jgi:3-dehydroquinate synthase
VIDVLVEDLAAGAPGRVLVLISDDIVAPLHAEPLMRRLRRRGLSAKLLTFPHGEANKSRRTKQRLEDGLSKLGAGRDSALVAVGGGVTGDLAGFVAATWHRGIPVVQVPTTLLAMADAALGGKTAVNLPGGKNLVGCFHQPWGVYADVALLETLPQRHFRPGLAEVVKSAVIADAGLFRWLEVSVERVTNRDPVALARVVAKCMRIKGRVVTRDETEAGRRAILNFGHTVGHALEAATGYRVAHGRAVAIGMGVEAALAERSTGFPPAHTQRLRRLLRALGLPLALPRSTSISALVAACRKDKKALAGQTRFALPACIGAMPAGPPYTVAVDSRQLRSALAARLD